MEDIQDIVKDFGMSGGSVRTLLHRMRERLHGFLEESGVIV